MGGVIVRVISINEQLHKIVWNPHKLDLFEYIAKNAAVRRARGKYLLLGNPDNCWSEDLTRLLSRRRLWDDIFYTAVRGEVRQAVPTDICTSALSMQQFVSEHSYAQTQDTPDTWVSQMPRAACIPGQEPLEDEPATFLDEMLRRGWGNHSVKHLWRSIGPFLHGNGTGDFFLAPRQMMMKTRGYPEVPQNSHVDALMTTLAIAHGYGHLIMGPGCLQYHQPHLRTSRFRTTIPYSGILEIQVKMLQLRHLANILPDHPDTCSRGEGDIDGVSGDCRGGAARGAGVRGAGTGGEWLEKHPPRDWSQWNDENWGFGSEVLQELELHSVCL